MLHGAISHDLLPYSALAFNPPAWSLSLEWQFYLIAPFVVVLAGRPKTALSIALIVAALEIAFRFDAFGRYEVPSFIVGAAGYFTLGIASRLAYPPLKGTIRNPYGIAAVCIVLLPLGWQAAPLLIWMLIMAGLLLNHAVSEGKAFHRVYDAAFESTIVTYLGSRSYSTYLTHVSFSE
jgi:peptidoglycan/LPS O-acetylase OafA/YrhL